MFFCDYFATCVLRLFHLFYYESKSQPCMTDVYWCVKITYSFPFLSSGTHYLEKFVLRITFSQLLPFLFNIFIHHNIYISVVGVGYFRFGIIDHSCGWFGFSISSYLIPMWLGIEQNIMALVLCMPCILLRSLIISRFSSFFLQSEIRRDKKSENMMNFLCLLTAIRVNASSITQASALKMAASSGQSFFYNSFVEYCCTTYFFSVFRAISEDA